MKQPSNNPIRDLSDDEVLAVTGGHAGPGGGNGISPVLGGDANGFGRGSLSHDGSGNSTQTIGIGMGKGIADTPPSH